MHTKKEGNVIPYQATSSTPSWHYTLTKFPGEDADIGILYVSVEYCHIDEKSFYLKSLSVTSFML